MRKEEQTTHSYFYKTHRRHSYGPERAVNMSISERNFLARQNAAKDNEK